MAVPQITKDKKIFVSDIKITLKTCPFVHSPVLVWVLVHFVPIVLQQFSIWTLTHISPLLLYGSPWLPVLFSENQICLCYFYIQEFSNGFLLPIHMSVGQCRLVFHIISTISRLLSCISHRFSTLLSHDLVLFTLFSLPTIFSTLLSCSNASLLIFHHIPFEFF